MQTLAPVATPEVVVLTTHGAASDDKARSMTIPRALDEGELQISHQLHHAHPMVKRLCK